MLNGAGRDCLCVPVGVLVARKVIEQPWQEERWCALEVVTGSADDLAARVGHREHSAEQFLMAPLELALDRREATDYRVNLANGEPAVYVGLASEPGQMPPIRVSLLTLSPFLAHRSGGHEPDAVDRVSMPRPLFDIVSRFLAGATGMASPLPVR